MQQYADLELSLHRIGTGNYSVNFRFSHPESEADIGLAQGKNVTAAINPSAESLIMDLTSAEDYGHALTAMVFQDPDLSAAFAKARASAQTLNVPLRMRLWIGPSAPELNSLRWETLRDPQEDTCLATDENIFFSRYFSSMDWHPVRLHPRGKLHALIAVSSPSDLKDYNMATVNVEDELSRAREALGNVVFSSLPTLESGSHVTVDAITDSLRQDEYDIFYLICHGRASTKGEPFLCLEDSSGKMARIAVTDFVAHLKDLQHRPRLIVLVSCQSAGKGTGDVLSALGPRLAEIGVPAVLAMQDNISFETAEKFMPVFFEELIKDGQIDRAMAVARGKVRSRVDQWVPVLFMRLKSGRLWYTPGFGEAEGFRKFPAQINNIKMQRCTPILGPGLVEPIFGSLKEIASRWAEAFHYPMSPYERESLPQVAQYLTVDQDLNFPFDKLKDYLQEHIRSTLKEKLPAELLMDNSGLDELIEAAGRRLRVENEHDPHRILANLPLPLFITVNGDNLLESALSEATIEGKTKKPETLLCPWNEYIEKTETIFDRDPDYTPTPERPLVFHLFGRWNEPDSVVLTEDNYFDFLIGTTNNKDLIPGRVREALSDTALLFLGFQTEEWNFRVLFRTILALPSSNRRSRFAHIAAQLEPEDERILEPLRARKYLADYFKGAAIDIYWGSPEEFLRELMRERQKETVGR